MSDLNTVDKSLLELVQEDPGQGVARQMIASWEREIMQQEIDEWWAARPAGLFGGGGPGTVQRMMWLLDDLERIFGK